MGHVPLLYVHYNLCYSRWCYGQILVIAPLTTINVWENRKNTLSTILHSSWTRGRVNLIFSANPSWEICAKLCNKSHHFMSFVTIVIQGGAMAKFWPLYHYNQCMGENTENTLSTILHSSWKSERVNLIFPANSGWDMC